MIVIPLAGNGVTAKTEEQTLGAKMSSSMTPIEQAIRDFDKHARAVENLIDSLNTIIEPAPESVLCETLWGVLGAYRDAIGSQYQIGDWLDWWWLECNLGANQMQAGLAGEAQRTIATVDDLVKLICDDLAQAQEAEQ